MGMDVYGSDPTTEHGVYFRNNVWWWRPLWNYVITVGSEVISEELAESGHYNDGARLNADQAKRLGEILFIELWEGRTLTYQAEYNEYLSQLERQPCDLCLQTGIRTDKLGVEMGQPTKELSPEVQILTGRTHGWCNGCNGVGTVEHFAAHYPFSVENVANFAQFCIESGGFKIC